MLLTLCGLPPAAAPADALPKIDPALQLELDRADADRHLPIIVMLADQADLERLGAEATAAGLDRRERARFVMEAQKEVARATQPAIGDRLDVLRADGTIADDRALWLINAFVLEARPAGVLELAARADVARVFLDQPIEAPRLVERDVTSSSPGQAEDGLRVIDAPYLWERGLTGEGMIVMNIDSGVDGNHPAYAGRWLGLQPEVTFEDAWYDPVQGVCPTPCDYGSHGTAVIGPLTGLETATADTIGVAFDADWIAAALVVSGASVAAVLSGFEWAAEPGPNPTRPPADVISCSFQSPGLTLPQECGPNGTYWAVVDAFEALGGAVVWAGGNDGPAAGTITKPKNRITTPVNFFAVGNVNPHQAHFPIHLTSSRGPSTCDNQTPKPEVVAPGTAIRYPAVGGGYLVGTGTSLAAPHVGGIIALLMQAFSWATGEEIKYALLATAIDLGDPGEDNDYGMGIIDAGAAYELLAGAAALRAAPPVAPDRPTLNFNRPNPFNPSTSITFELPEAAAVRLLVHDPGGRLVTTLIDERRSAGSHRAHWDGRHADGGGAASGIYFFRLETRQADGGTSVQVRKAVLVQ
jgi:bacillopeptidase F